MMRSSVETAVVLLVGACVPGTELDAQSGGNDTNRRRHDDDDDLDQQLLHS